ncbi:hypothetical protein EO087_01750 [Dyella sp. M7H15-1]|uniref:S24 family peptidase n=1 Tax=Dyella sp. M7H15-1 TaxID=2501295 RepID=UPI001004F79E|nr:hypothetical protein [Dyella sp. M7H15-1]QAU22867.1 hypothetical protein EO087_01750 [Dyella sp. M7H15-1]
MDIFDIRHRNVRLLVQALDKEAGGTGKRSGGMAMFADRLQKQPAQVTHFAGARPIKRIGSKIAREVDSAFGHPPGWLDTPHWQESEYIAAADRSSSEYVATKQPTTLPQHVQIPYLEGYDSQRTGSITIPLQLLQHDPTLMSRDIRALINPEDNMAGEIEQYDLVFVNAAVRKFERDGIYAYKLGDIPHIRRIQDMGGGQLRFVGTRSYEENFVLSGESLNDLHIGGRVIGRLGYRKF